MAPPTETLTQRELNRATLARQHLLSRERLQALDAVEHLAGLQAQTPHGPYVSLFSRLDGFDPMELSAALEDRRAVRGWFMRATIHLMSARDCLEWWPLTDRVLARAFKGTKFSKQLGSAPLPDLLAAARAMVEAEPLPRAEISRRLAQRWPDGDPDSLGAAAGYRLPLVQVTPRGLWARSAQPKLTTIASWLGAPLAEDPSLESIVLRYLGALGPATVKDFQNWSGMTRIAEVVEPLRPSLVTFEGEDGRELFDLPDARRPGADASAPPRFLPEYDNVLLGHADRTRFFDGDPKEGRYFRGSGADNGTLLVDGLLKATWKMTRDGKDAELWVRPFRPIARSDRAEIKQEGERLLGLIASGAGRRRVRISKD
jgi:hypothetical protein